MRNGRIALNWECTARFGGALAASGTELVKAKSMYGMRGRRVLLLCAMTISKNIRGFCFALLGGISWGFSGACAQYLFHHYNVDPLWVSSVRMLCAGIVLCAFALAIARGPFLAMWRNRNTVASLVIFSVFGLASCQITYLLAIQNSNAGTATVIQYIAPVLVVLYLCVRSHRRPLKREVLAIALVMMGTFLVATHGNPNSLALTPAGLFWSLVSAVTYAMYTLIPRRLMLHYGSVPVVAGALLIGGIMLSIVLQSWTVNPGFDFSGWLLLFFGLVLFGTIIGFTLYFQAVKDIGATKTGIVASIETVSATMFAVLWLGTSFSWIDIVGFVFIMATVFVLAKHPGDGDIKAEG